MDDNKEKAKCVKSLTFSSWSEHLWTDDYSVGIGGRVCVKCGTKINVFALRNSEQTIPKCKTV